MRARPPIATSAVQKLEAKRLQALTRQREKLEAEVQGLEKEILDLVSNISVFFFRVCFA
jgi:cell division protein FtsB